jgi:hypothetical protein
MPESLRWNFAIQVSGGPTIAGNGGVPTEVETYHKASVSVPANSGRDVQLLTGAGGKVKLLVIQPAKATDKLTFEANGKDVPLDGPLVLIGSGAASLFGDVGTIKFKNNTAEDAVVSLLAARDATP